MVPTIPSVILSLARSQSTPHTFFSFLASIGKKWPSNLPLVHFLAWLPVVLVVARRKSILKFPYRNDAATASSVILCSWQPPHDDDDPFHNDTVGSDQNNGLGLANN